MSTARTGEGACRARKRARSCLGLLAAAVLAWSGYGVFRADTGFAALTSGDRADGDAELATSAVLPSRARASLEMRPIDGAAFRAMGQAAFAHGDRKKAIELYLIAARRDPRDQLTRALLLDDALKRGAHVEAITQLDALLRVAPQLRNVLLQSLAPELVGVELRAAVVSAMATEPPWAGAMLSALRSPSLNPDVAAMVMEELANRRELTPAELSTRIDALIRIGRASDARATWLGSLPVEQRVLADEVFDGGFEEPEPITGEFAWAWGTVAGVELSLETGVAASGRQSLRIDFSGRAVSLRAPSQRLALPPGRYQFSGAFDDQTSNEDVGALSMMRMVRRSLHPLTLFIGAFAVYNLLGLLPLPWLLDGLYDKALPWRLFGTGLIGLILGWIVQRGFFRMRRRPTEKRHLRVRRVGGLLLLTMLICLIATVIRSHLA